MDVKKILFVCIHNSARSQIAEAFLNVMAPEAYEAESAGIEPGTLNPIVVDVMKDAGIDGTRRAQSLSVEEWVRLRDHLN